MLRPTILMAAFGAALVTLTGVSYAEETRPQAPDWQKDAKVEEKKDEKKDDKKEEVKDEKKAEAKAHKVPATYEKRFLLEKDHKVHIQAGLQWLADHQNKGGYWSPDEYHADSLRIEKWKAKKTQVIDSDDEIKNDADIGLALFRDGLTALSMLAFLADGHTHETGTFKDNVSRAADYLLGIQDKDGCFGATEADDYIYTHAIATLALSELICLSGAEKFKTAAQKGVEYIIKAQNVGVGWRYGVQTKESDTSVTAWMIMALHAAKEAGLKFDSKTAYKGAIKWVDLIEGKDAETNEVKTGYNFPASGNVRPINRDDWAQNQTMNACDVCIRVFTRNEKANSKEVRAIARPIPKDLPKWREKGEDGKVTSHGIDFYYWMYASKALHQVGGDYWKDWEKALFKPILIKYQRGWHADDVKAFEGKDLTKGAGAEGEEGRHLLEEHGSWDPLGPWGVQAGRIGSTAFGTLALLTPYSHARLLNVR